MITAEITQDPDSSALWLMIDSTDSHGGIRSAHPIQEDEVEAIKEACEVWLEEESQRVMKDNLAKGK